MEIHYSNFPPCEFRALDPEPAFNSGDWLRPGKRPGVLEALHPLLCQQLWRNSILLCIQPTLLLSRSLNCHIWIDWILRKLTKFSFDSFYRLLTYVLSGPDLENRTQCRDLL